RELITPGDRRQLRGRGDRLLGGVEVDPVMLERHLDVRRDVGCDPLSGGGRVGAGQVNPGEHVLPFRSGGPHARQQLAGFQGLDSGRSTEMGPSHGDLPVYEDPTGELTAPAADEGYRLPPG